MLVAYVPNATNNFEISYDAPLMVVSSDVLFFILDDYKLGIQERQYPLNRKDVVQLGNNHFVTGDHFISLHKGEGVFANRQNIYLKDLLPATLTNLSEENYIFAGTVGLTEGRFQIVYENDLILNADTITKNQLIVYRNGNEFVIQSTDKKINLVELYDLSGRLLNKIQSDTTTVYLDGNLLVTGAYVLKINRNGEITIKRIIK